MLRLRLVGVNAKYISVQCVRVLFHRGYRIPRSAAGVPRTLAVHSMHVSAPFETGLVIKSRSNARVKALRASLGGEASRPGDLLGLEGPKLILEAHAAEYEFETVFLREGSEEVLRLHPALRELRAQYRVVLGRDLFDSTVTTRSPQGIAATCVLRKLELKTPVPTNTLVLERIQDPGNLGTLLRSAESFGVPRVMVTPDTANQWNPKVMRAGAGAILRTPVQRAPILNLLQQLQSEGVRIFAAVAHFGAAYDLALPHGVLTGRRVNAAAPQEERDEHLPPSKGRAASFSYDTDFQHPYAILIGNEGSGLSAEALAMSDEQVLIPGAAERNPSTPPWQAPS